MPALTQYGQQLGLIDDRRALLSLSTSPAQVDQGGIAHIATKLKLYDNTSTATKTMSSNTFNTPGGGGYADKTIAKANWTPSVGGGGDTEMVLANQTFTASGGSINNVQGAFITDPANNEIAWWERSSAVTLALGDTITADALTIRIV